MVPPIISRVVVARETMSQRRQLDSKSFCSEIGRGYSKLIQQVCSSKNNSKSSKKNGVHSTNHEKSLLFQKKTVYFAKAHREKGMNLCQKVVFTDELKFNIFGSDGRAKVWRKKNNALSPKNLVSTVKHGGGNIMGWGAVAASGVGRLVFIEGNMDRYKYKSLLKVNLKSSVDDLELGPGWVFQQDNYPKHTAHIVKDWLLYHAPRQLNANGGLTKY